MEEKICKACGKSWQTNSEDYGFVTCPQCRKPLNEIPRGCNHWNTLDTWRNKLDNAANWYFTTVCD